MTVQEVRERADEDLQREIASLQKEIWNLRFRKGSEKAGDPSKVRAMRRDVARMLTVLRERRLGLVRGTQKA